MDFFTHVTVLAAGAVLLVQQILKLKIVPLSFANKYPVPTNILLSIIAAVVIDWRVGVKPHSWTDWLGLVGTISVVAAISYNQLFKKWSDLQAMEGPASK